MQSILNTYRLMGAMVASAVFCGAMAIPATAYASNNYQVITVDRIHPYLNAEQKKIWVHTIRYTGQPLDPVELTATLSADGSSVTITVDSTAIGGLVIGTSATSYCTLTTADTAVCSTTYAPNNVVKAVQVEGSGGDDVITVDVPGLQAMTSSGAGNDTISVPRSTTATLSGGAGNDTLIGGTGTDYITADQGTDTIYVASSPAAPDSVWCGNSAVESPVDTVYVDSADTLMNTNCLHVY